MKTILRFVALVIVIVFSVSLLVAQTTFRDVVYLKNGGVIKGVILEMVPDKTVKIQTSDGSVFVYNMSDVDRITKESVPTGEPSAISTERSTDIFQGLAFSVCGGAAIPTGDFADKNNGDAKTGFMVGAQLVTGGTIGFVINGSYVHNTTEIADVVQGLSGMNLSGESGSWSSIQLLGGIKVGTTNPTGVNFSLMPLIGVLIGYSPKVDINFSETETFYGETMTITGTAKVESKSSSALAYGIGAEVIFGKSIALGARYLYSKPKYDLEENLSATVTSSSYTSSTNETEVVSAEQKTSVVLVYLSVYF